MFCIYYFLFGKIIKERKKSMVRSAIKQEMKQESSGKNNYYTRNAILLFMFVYTNKRSLFILQEEKPRTFLDILFESLHEEEKYSEQYIRDEIKTFVIYSCKSHLLFSCFRILFAE